MKILRALVLCVLALFSASGFAAQFFLESNAFYYSDGVKVSETTTQTKMLMDFALGFTVDKKNRWQIGWNYSLHSSSTTGGSEETYSSNEMGPKFGYYFDKNRRWGTSFAYNLIVNGTYKASAAAAEQTLRGTSMRFDIGYGTEVTESFRMGARLVYNLATYAEEIDNTTLTKVSYSRTFIYPALHLSYLF